MGKNEEYNGWTNYATWRIHLEMFDERVVKGEYDAYKLGQILREETEEVLGQQASGLALSLALSFLDEVDWRQIATHCMSEDGIVSEDTEEDLRGEQA
jgi:hypothetical protein